MAVSSVSSTLPCTNTTDTAARFWLKPNHIVGLAILANLFLFVRVAVIYAPYFTYQGPSGSDRVFYYAYVRSLVIDGDLDMTNEMEMKPPTGGLFIRDGKPLNKYAIGMPLLSLPAFFLMHIVMLAASALGLTGIATDGYSWPYPLTFAVSQMAWAMLGIWLLYRALTRFCDARTAALGVVTAWFGTNVLLYTAADLIMSHAAALFSVSWCTYAAVRLRETPLRWTTWLQLGASSAMTVLVRFQDAIYLLVPAAAALVALREGIRSHSIPLLLRCLGIGAVSFFLMFLPQMIVWKILFGSWLKNSYSEEFSFDWFHPHVVELLFTEEGLLHWLPVIVAGIIGCFAVAWRSKDLLAAAAGTAWLLNFYVISAWWAWDVIAQRCTFDMLFPLALGCSFFIGSLRRKWPLLTLGLIGLIVICNIPYVIMHNSPFVSGWLNLLKLNRFLGS